MSGMREVVLIGRRRCERAPAALNAERRLTALHDGSSEAALIAFPA
ncbi:hypothetical protein OHA99_15850 [Streptomyces coelicoflavus]